MADDVSQRLDELEGALMEEVSDDARLSSSVPAGPDAGDLDFIQMTGLTAPVAQRPDSEAGPTPGTLEMDPTLPVSFYEEGVDDVDGSKDPLSPRDAPGEDQDLLGLTAQSPEHTPGVSRAADQLKSIIADLEDPPKAETAAKTEDTDEIPSLDLEESSPEIAPTQEIAPDTEALGLQEPEEPSLDEYIAAGDDLVAVSEVDVPEEGPPAPVASGPDSPEMQAEPPSVLPEPAPPPEPPAPSPPPLQSPPVTPAPADLTEAESLLHQLEVQERESTVTPDALASPIAPAPWESNDPKDSGGPDENSETDESVYHRPQSVSSPRKKRSHKSVARRLLRWGLRLVLISVVIVGAFEAFQFYQSETASPREAYDTGLRFIQNGAFHEASSAFENCARRYPLDSLRAEAQFMAGYALQLVPPSPHDRAQDAYKRASALFTSFIADNPSHVKRARAQTLIGILKYRVGAYREAISRLEDSERRLRDPAAYLPSLRTIGRCYAALGEIENARLAFLRAASAGDNFSPDSDYLELAALYESLSERTTDEKLRTEYRNEAIKHWDFALRVPGLLKSDKRGVELLRDVMVGKLAQEERAAPASHEEEEEP